MKNTIVRILSLVLAILLALPLAACGEDAATTPKKTAQKPSTDEAKEPMHDLSDYVIIYGNKIHDRALDATGTLSALLEAKLGKRFFPTGDLMPKTTEKEILIGNTNRPESAEVLELLTGDDAYVIKTVGEKIVINAKDDQLLVMAIGKFIELARENEFSFGTEIEYLSGKTDKIDIIKGGASDYKIAYLEGLHTSGGTEGKAELEVEFSRKIRDKLKESFRAELEVVDGSVKSDFEILLGDTGRAESDEFINSLAPNEYGFEIKGNKVTISGTNATTIRRAAELFIDSVDFFGEDGDLSVYDGMRLTKLVTKWNVDIPEYEGGTFAGVHDGGHNSFAFAYENTSDDEFDAYCEKLKDEGYLLEHQNKIMHNESKTFTHETRGFLHVYYNDVEETVRIVSYFDGDYNLPTSFEPEEYEKITDTKISGYGISGGMCFVITLEDGSFIVIDSGTTNTADTFYKFLQSLNKRPDGKILIRAWYLTHEHSDHFYMFQHFMKKYGKSVTIEEFWCNNSSFDYPYYGDNRNVMWDECYEEYRGYVNGDFKWITLHTGMEFYAANMKFEVLYTEEDIFPRRTLSYNDMILVMKMTDTTSGQTVLWLGDLMKVGCETLLSNYGSFLKCDLLQVSHHGMSEALPLYQKVRPSVAMWPTTTEKRKKNDEVKGGIYKPTTAYLDNNVPTNIYANGIYTIALPFKTGDEITEYKYK